MKIIQSESDSGKAVSIEVAEGTKPLKLKEPLELEKVGPVLDLLKKLGNYIDWQAAEVDKNITDFVKDLTDNQRRYLEVLLNANGKQVSSETIQAKLKIKPLVIAGLRSGMTRKAKNWYGMEEIDENEWNHNEWQNYYRINPKYFAALKQLMSEDVES
jgi:hypothetical protein